MSAPRRVSPESPARRGWCPSLARPMATGDGLLARVHPPLGLLTIGQARAVAEAARRFGNGHIDVTARANLQIRGVTEATAHALAATLAAAGLGDARADGGPQRLTLTPTFAGLRAGDVIDVPALARAIEAAGLGIAGLPAKALVAIEAAGGLAERRVLSLPPQTSRLPDACSWALESGKPDSRGGRVAREAGRERGTPPFPARSRSPLPVAPRPPSPAEGGGKSAVRLSATKPEADIRLVATAPGALALALASEDSLVWLGGVAESAAPALVAMALRALAASGRRRMRDLLPEDRARLVETLGLPPSPAQTLAPAPLPGLHALDDGRVALALDAPFGRCDAGGLDALTDQAERLGCDIRLSPSRGFALLAADAAAARAARDALSGLFITAPDDSRGAVAACPGAPACASGSTPTLPDAGRLAEAFRPFAARGLRAHVSGCAKGCAHPSAADLTLVGRDGLYDVVLDGRPDALPATRLTFEAALERVRRADPATPPGLALHDAFRTIP